jgi:lipoprotein-anchoring transpeptidase ErfK/SrfK
MTHFALLARLAAVALALAGIALNVQPAAAWHEGPSGWAVAPPPPNWYPPQYAPRYAPRYAQPRAPAWRAPQRMAAPRAPTVRAPQPAQPAAVPRAPAPQQGPGPEYERQVVNFETNERPGTIIIDVSDKFLSFVLPEGRAIRYGIGVGRDGFGWTGAVKVRRKAEWPDWYPPASMIEREPWLARYANGMPGGPNNPLGARALYLYEGDRDTLYRIHGTNEPWTIGRAVSSGCFRMLNEDVTDLYERVEIGAKVIVR